MSHQEDVIMRDLRVLQHLMVAVLSLIQLPPHRFPREDHLLRQVPVVPPPLLRVKLLRPGLRRTVTTRLSLHSLLGIELGFQVQQHRLRDPP